MVYICCTPAEKEFLERHEIPFEAIGDSLYISYPEIRKHKDNEKVVRFLEKHAKFDNLIFQDTMDDIRRVS